MATESFRRLVTLSTTVTAPASAGTGVGSVILAAVAAVGAATVVLQLGGCATGTESTDPVAAAASDDVASAWTSPNYREGWYADPVEVAETDEIEIDERPYDADSTTVTGAAEVEYSGGIVDATAVRTSLFPEFATAAVVDDVYSGDENLTQISFATEGSDFDPDLAPDGSWMVFASTQHHEQADLYRKSVDGRVVTQLTNDPSQDVMPEVSPDGSRVAFASDRHGNWDVFVMSTDGGPITQITFDDAQELHPTWAPDGEHLCYCRFNDRTGQWELWTLAVDRPSARSFVCEGMFPRWSPDQSRDRILFQKSRKRGERLYGVWTIDLVDGDGVNPTEIVAAGDAAIMHPTWSPDGTRIAYTTVADPSVSADGMPVECDIWSIAADGSGRIALTSGGFRNLRPNWGPDDRVYFVSNRGGHDVIWAVSGSTHRSMPASTPAAVATSMPADDGHAEADSYDEAPESAPASTVAGAGGYDDTEH